MKETEVLNSTEVEKVKEILETRQCDIEIFYTDESIFTVEDASRSVGAPPEEILKSLILLVDGSPVLALMSGTNRVDLKKIRKLLGARKVSMAKPDYVYEYSGFRIGGVPPIGYKEQPMTLLDQDLFQYSKVWAAAGNDHSFFPISPFQLEEITHGRKEEIRK